MVLVNRYIPKLCIINPLKRVGTNFKIFMKEIQKSKQQSFKLTEVSLKEDENIAAYFLRFNETVNAILGLGEETKESIIVQKVLRSLPMIFDPKISALEEREDINSITMNELQ